MLEEVLCVGNALAPPTSEMRRGFVRKELEQWLEKNQRLKIQAVS